VRIRSLRECWFSLPRSSSPPRLRRRSIHCPRNDGPAKAIVEFVQTTTTNGSPKFVPPAERVARSTRRHAVGRAADVFTGDVLPHACLRLSGEIELKVEPFKTVMSGNRERRSRNCRKQDLQDSRGDADRHVGRDVQRRSEEVDQDRRDPAGSGPARSSLTCRCRRSKYLRDNGCRLHRDRR
jgi:hypothetical protein